MMNKTYTDGELVKRFQNGDETAFNELYERYHKLVYFVAYEMCHNDADAKDILQETFIQVKKSILEMKEPDNFKPWLNRIVINKCKNLFRSRKTVELDEDNVWFKNHMLETRSYMLPEKQLHFESDQELVYKFINELSNPQKEVLVLRYFQHYSMKEMSVILDVPEGTIKTRLLYAKNNLKKLIQNYEKTTGIKVNFKADTFMAELFAYAGYQSILPKLKANINIHPIKKLYHIVQSSSLWVPVTCVSLVGIMTISTVMTFQEYNKPDPSPTIEHSSLNNIQNVESSKKKLYFQLMDWACCKDDMEVKTKNQFEEIMPIYHEMTAIPSQYLERLKSDHWMEAFEEVYQSF